MSLLKKSCLVFLLLMLFMFTMLIFLLNTSPGLRLMLNSATFLLPGLEFTSVSGRWHNLTIKQLHYRISGVNISAGELHMSIDLGCLYKSKFCLNNLSLRDVLVEVKTAELSLPVLARQQDVKNGSVIYAPYPLILRQLSMNNIHIQVDTTVIKLNKLNSGLIFNNNTLIVTPTRLSKLLVLMPTNVQTVNYDTYISLQEHIETKAEHEEIYTNQSLIKKAQALFAKPLLPQLSNFTMPLHLKLEEIEGEDLQIIGNNHLIITRLSMRAAIHYQSAELTFLEINSPYGFISAFGNVQFGDQWPITLTIYTNLNKNFLKGEKITFTISGELYNELYININFSGFFDAQLVLKIQLAKKGLPLILTMDSTDLWLIDSNVKYQFYDIALRIEGKAQDYQMKLKATLSREKQFQVNIVMEAKGNLYGLTLSKFTLGTLEDYINLTAVVNWQHDISWHSELTFGCINMANQWPALPVKIAGIITTYGSLDGNNWQFNISELNISGNINKNRLTVRGSLNGNSAGQWQVPKLLLTLGCNTLEVKGNLNDKSTLEAILHAPVLNAIFPSLNGSVQGSIKLLGSLKEPQFLVNLSSKDLYWSNFTISQIYLTSKLQLSDILSGNIHLQIDQLQKGTLSVNQLVLSAIGHEKQHKLKLLIHGPIAGQLCIIGNLNRAHQSWHAVLDQSYLVTLLEKWILTPNEIILNYQFLQKKMVISPHCWKSINAHICVLQDIEVGASGHMNVMLSRFNLAMLKPLLPIDMQASGVFTGYADLLWNADDNFPSGKILMMGNKVLINKNIQGKTSSVVFDTITLSARLDKRRAYLDWLINTNEHGKFNGHVQVVDIHNQYDLSGHININGMSLALFNTLLTYDVNMDGLLNANLHLSGNLCRPQLNGQLLLEQLVIKGDLMSLSMVNDRLVLNFFGTTSGLSNMIINSLVNNNFNYLNDWHVRISTREGLMHIILPPKVRLDISPDIVFEATPVLFMLNGKINIPWARIEVQDQDIPYSITRVSSDEVLLGDDLKILFDSTESTDSIVDTNLLVHIGNDVSIDAFGLKAKLTGDFKVAKGKQGLGINGHINIPSGYFHIYGQNLILNKGQLLFSGPFDHPYFNIEAIRNPDTTDDDVTVGIRVTGPVNQLKIEIFSDPIKSQQEALSYLFRGQGLEASSADNNIITSILIRMGVVHSGQFLDRVGEAFGVSHLTLDTKGVGESSQVVVSGYIIPDLQVRYGIGIFDSLATLTLRYRIMSKIYFEAVSGFGQSCNLILRLEF